MMIRSKALHVVHAAARLKMLAARRRQQEQSEEDTQTDTEALLADEEPIQPQVGASQKPESAVSNRWTDALQRSRSLSGSKRRPSVLASDCLALKEVVFGNWVNLLLVVVPLGIVAGALKWNPTAVFVLNFTSLIPLALLLGDVTEDLALRYGSIIGGLLNATFGNVVEVILSIAALLNGLYGVVAASLLGSILSNLLLVTGCSFFFGGLFNKTQRFNAAGIQTSGSMLFLAALGFLIPTGAGLLFVKHEDGQDGGGDLAAAAAVAAAAIGGSGEEPAGSDVDGMVLRISRGTAVLLLISYACYLGFQLYTHSDLFEDNGGEDGEDGEATHQDQPMLSLATALGLLTVITITVAVASEYLTSSLEKFSESSGLGKAFLGTIVLPIAGNACEHMTAVIVATKNKMDLSMGVAIGSSIQVALFAVPLAVVVGWATGHPFSLSFDPFSALALMLSVAQVNFVTAGATSHWLLGVQLIVLFVLLSIAYFFK